MIKNLCLHIISTFCVRHSEQARERHNLEFCASDREETSHYAPCSQAEICCTFRLFPDWSAWVVSTAWSKAWVNVIWQVMTSFNRFFFRPPWSNAFLSVENLFPCYKTNFLNSFKRLYKICRLFLLHLWGINGRKAKKKFNKFRSTSVTFVAAVKIGNQDKNRAHHYVCYTCDEGIRRWSND